MAAPLLGGFVTPNGLVTPPSLPESAEGCVCVRRILKTRVRPYLILRRPLFHLNYGLSRVALLLLAAN